MSFLILSLLYFSLIVLGFILNSKALHLGKVFVYLYILFIFIFCFFLVPNIGDYSRDFNNYYNWFLKIHYEGVEDGILSKDPLFQYIVYSIQLFFGNNYIIIFSFFFILISIMKFLFSKQLNIGFYFLIFLWLLFGQTFILHEITQIRGGLAIAMCSLFIIRDLNVRNNWNFIFILGSYFVHESVIVLIFFYLVCIFFRNLILRKNVLLFVYFIGVILGVFFKNIISSYLSIYFIGNVRASDYLDSTYEGVFEVSLFSTLFLIKSLSIFVAVYFFDSLNDMKKTIVFFSVVSCFFYSLFSFNSVFAYRFSEVFIYFSIATMVYPLCIRKLNVEIKYAWFLCLMVLGWIFMYSSTKVLSNN